MKIKSNNGGYTLIELAMVVLIVGLTIGSGLSIYSLYQTERKKSLTETSMLRINLAIEAFKERYGRYPCPSSYTAVRGSPAYGREGNCADISVTPGECRQGICVERSIAGRTVELDDGTVVTPRIRRGAVPFMDLNLFETDFYDQYGGRISYAVTELLTNDDTYDVRRGGIHVVDGQLPTAQSLLETPGSALFFINSHGPDNIGAYGRNGDLLFLCDGPMFDVENCNTSSTHSAAIYRYAQKSDMAVETGGVETPSGGTPPVAVNVNIHYDDYSYYRGGGTTPLFKISEVVGSEIHAHDLKQTARIVVGDDVPNDERINVEGIVRANQPYITQSVCNQDGGDCFSPEKIGGSGMPCPQGQYADGVHGGGVGGTLTCREPVATTDCDDRRITGFQNGAPVCDTTVQMAMCAQTNVTICNIVRVLQTSAHNTQQTVSGGVSSVQTWRCNDGTWSRISTTGVCTCTPGTRTTRNSCGTGYTGQTTVQTTTVCPSGQQTARTDRSACSCAPGTSTRQVACPSGQTGSITETRTTTCRGNVATTSSWRETGNTCTCAAQAPQTRRGVCPSGTQGDINERRVWNTSTCSWGAWTTTSNTCTCTDRTETRTLTCPPGQTGGIVQSRNVYCNGNPPSAWVQVSNNCATTPATSSCRWSISNASMTSGNAGPNAGSNCNCSNARPGPCKVQLRNGITQGYTNCTCE